MGFLFTNETKYSDGVHSIFIVQSAKKFMSESMPTTFIKLPSRQQGLTSLH